MTPLAATLLAQTPLATTLLAQTPLATTLLAQTPLALSLDTFAVGGRLYELAVAALLVLWLVLVLVRRR